MADAKALLYNYRFVVLIGKDKIGFSKVQGLKSTVNFDQISEGGLNNVVHMVKAVAKQNDKLTFERGAYSGSALATFTPGERITKPMTVVLMDDNGAIGRSYAVQNPIVEEWELSDLDASSSSIVIERFTVVHNGIDKV